MDDMSEHPEKPTNEKVVSEGATLEVTMETNELLDAANKLIALNEEEVIIGKANQNLILIPFFIKTRDIKRMLNVH